MLLPGIKVNTSPPTDHVPVEQMQFMRFNGKTWERFEECRRELTVSHSGASRSGEPGISRLRVRIHDASRNDNY